MTKGGLEVRGFAAEGARQFDGSRSERASIRKNG